ncbi:MAG: IS21 family transposase [Candidatus Omnitrophica bacterium]|nr:IS21 family transposase [Candidatus Omnitrophota bacterium]
MLKEREKTKVIVATKAGMDVKTARKYLKTTKLPSELKGFHCWNTREDSFKEIWREIAEMLEINPGLEGKTIFDEYCRRQPGKWKEGQLRTLQRRIKHWRATEGPAKEVYFSQRHYPGELGEFDFTHMGGLKVTIQKRPFDHLVSHFVLTYSNWESVNICFSESYESLSDGLQNAFWELGAVPARVRTDSLSAAVHKDCNPETFTTRYRELLAHYGIEGEKINLGVAHENGDVEQRNYRFKRAIDQALMLRGSRDFNSREEYSHFLKKILVQLNAGRKEKLEEEYKTMKSLPASRLESCKRVDIRVRQSSTVRILRNTYSVHSRLRGEQIKALVYTEHIDLWYAQKKVDTLPRLRGESKYEINYKHIIEGLVRKPGAFKNYRYREELFPNTYFRIVYDSLKAQGPDKADKEYLKILYLAFKEGELKVVSAIRKVLFIEEWLSADRIEQIILANEKDSAIPKTKVEQIELKEYDSLLSGISGEVMNRV